MKTIVNISLASSNDDYKFETLFLGKKFEVLRLGTDGDFQKAEELLLHWNKKADAIGLGGIQFPYSIGPGSIPDKKTRELIKLGSQMETTVTTGNTLRMVGHEWSLRHIQFKFGNYFTNAKVLFFSGLVNSTIAKVMSEYTDNLFFADPVIQNQIPRLLTSIKELKRFAGTVTNIMKWIPKKPFSPFSGPVRPVNQYMMKKAVREAHVLVVPHHNFYDFLEDYTIEELKDKTIITTTAYDDRVDFLEEKGVGVIIDTTPKMLKNVVGVCVLEAMIFAALDIPQGKGSDDDLLEIISDQRMDPRIIYPSGQTKKINRFAYLVHPMNRDFLKKLKPVEVLSEINPGAMKTIEKVMAYSPPFVYSKITGIKSPTGTEAEGWLIALGETPAQMDAHPVEFTTKRILQAGELAKKLGAQVMGLSLLPKSSAKSAEYACKHAVLPVTTGISYVASTALWATADAVRRMGLIKLERGKILKAKTMVIGATGDVGATCARLLATAFKEIHLVGRNIAKLLALQESIHEEMPRAKLQVSTRADAHLAEMDVIVAASSGAGDILDLMQVKPGCVICDITRPTIFSKEEVAKRPDILIIKGGEILLPGKNVEMRDIGLPNGVAYAGLAETIILALESRFEIFTMGTKAKWTKVREIYRLGMKHGMKLATISGLSGVYSDEDIARVKKNALKELKVNVSKSSKKSRTITG